ncbi:MAG: hypothetical protein ACI4J7_09165 [Ruminiclostridium sp.]
MKIFKRVFISVAAVIMMVTAILLLYFNQAYTNIEIIIAGTSVLVTIILGVTTYYQTKIQIKLDKLDKTPFYELVFPNTEDEFIENYYCRNCIPVIRVNDDCFVDFTFKNSSNVTVSSVEVIIDNDGFETKDGINSVSRKIEQIEQQEKSISDFAEFLKNADEEIIGDGICIFEKWEEIDTGMNSEYDMRARELILHLFYYYEPDFNSDLTVYRDKNTTNKTRKEILQRVISRGSNKEESFYEYFTKNKEGIIYHLIGKALSRVENKDKLKENVKYEQMAVNHNLIVNCQEFHYYIPFQTIKNIYEGKTLSMSFKISTIHGYVYRQRMEIVLSDKENIKIANLPDEFAIKRLKDELCKIDPSDDKRYIYEKNKIEDMKKARGKVYIDSLKMTIEEEK